jgi:hypothetical protein
MHNKIMRYTGEVQPADEMVNAKGIDEALDLAGAGLGRPDDKAVFA